MPMLNYDLDAISATAEKAIRSNNIPVMRRMLGQVKAMGLGLRPVNRQRAQQLTFLLSKKLKELKKPKRTKKAPDVSSASAG